MPAGLDADQSLPERVRRSLGEAIAASPSSISGLCATLRAGPYTSNATPAPSPQALAHHGAPPAPPQGLSPVAAAVHVLLHTARACPALCDAAVLGLVPEALMAAAAAARDHPGAAAATLCAACLAALAQLLSHVTPPQPAPARRPGSAAAAPRAPTPTPSTDDALRRLSGMVQLQQGAAGPADAAVAFCAAAAAAAYLRHVYVSLSSNGNNTGGGGGGGGPAPPGVGGGARVGWTWTAPPPEMLTPSRLAALARLLRYVPAGGAGAALEAVEGAPGQLGLCDGAVSLAAALLAYGPGSDPHAAAVQAGLGLGLVAVLSTGRGAAGAHGVLAELSPLGLTHLLYGAKAACLGEQGALALAGVCLPSAGRNGHHGVLRLLSCPALRFLDCRWGSRICCVGPRPPAWASKVCVRVPRAAGLRIASVARG